MTWAHVNPYGLFRLDMNGFWRTFGAAPQERAFLHGSSSEANQFPIRLLYPLSIFGRAHAVLTEMPLGQMFVPES
jgi:hypothetical protein